MTFLDGTGPRIIAHRGWHLPGDDGSRAGENTLEAFDRAVGAGFTYLETDVRISRDGVAMLFHDATLERTTDGTGPLERLTHRELGRLRVVGGGTIPTLADALHHFPGARFVLDPKTDAAVVPLVDTLRHAGAGDRVCIGSFSDRRLRTVRACLGPAVATSMGPREALSLRVRRHVRPGTATGVVAAQVPVALRGLRIITPGFVDRARAAGIEVHAWTVNTAAQMRHLLALGVEGIITDRPDLARTVVEQGRR